MAIEPGQPGSPGNPFEIPVIPFQPKPAPGVPPQPSTTTSGTETSSGNGSTTSNLGINPPRVIKNSEIKQKLLRPALTSNFQCWFNPPPAVRNHLKSKGFNYDFNAEFVSLLCSEASLPGSSILTNEINDDFTGITERLGYRKQYDDRADFTFYVDHAILNTSYNIIIFFEEWIRYAVGETSMAPDKGYFYRVRYPDGPGGYRSESVYLNKFERDLSRNYLEYRFIDAYPISITSMPVSYDSSQLLKCTVSFTYSRYLIGKYSNSITQQEFESALDAGIAAAYGYKAGSDMAQEFINKSSGGITDVKVPPKSISLQQQIRNRRLGL